MTRLLACIYALVSLAAFAEPATAEVNEIKLGKQYGLPYIQFVMMEDQKLIEKHAKLQGLGDIKVEWTTLGGAGADQRRHHLRRDRRRGCRTAEPDHAMGEDPHERKGARHCR